MELESRTLAVVPQETGNPRCTLQSRPEPLLSYDSPVSSMQHVKAAQGDAQFSNARVPMCNKVIAHLIPWIRQLRIAQVRLIRKPDPGS
jgi:hypothetical protein